MTDKKSSTAKVSGDAKAKPDPVASLTRRVAKLQAEVTAMKAQLGSALGVSFDD